MSGRGRLPDLVDIGELAENLRRNLPRTLGLAALGLAAGLLIVRLTPLTYQATTVVLAGDTPSVLRPEREIDPDSPPRRARSRTPDTEAELLRSGTVLGTVRAHLAAGQPLTREQLSERIRVSAPRRTNLLEVTYGAATPEAAVRGADAIAEAYVSARKEALSERADRVAAALWKRRRALQTRATALEETARSRPESSPVRSADLIRSRHLTQQILALDSGIALVAATVTTRTEIVRHARPPEAASRPNIEVPPLSGLFGGALAGLLWGYVRERRRPRVRDEAQVRQATGLAVFARLDTRERMRGLATEVRLVPAHRVLVTGIVPEALTTAVGKLLRAALGYVDEPAEVLVSATAPNSAYTLRTARTADLVLLVAEIGHSSLPDLVAATQLLGRTGTPAAVILAPASRAWRKGRT